MREPRRLRAPLAIAAACVLLAVSAVVYLHPVSLGRQAPPPAASPVAMPGIFRFGDLGVISGREAWVCLRSASSGLLYATSDGGRTWRKLPIPQVDDKYGVQPIDATHGLLQLGRGLYATSNGGRSWHVVPLPPGETFGLGARFLTPAQGWYLDLAVDPNRPEQATALWWTSNGGASWRMLWRVDAAHPTAGGVPFYGYKYVLGFRDALTGWLSVRVGSSGRLLQTSDGGRSWSEVPLPLPTTALPTHVEVLSGGAAVLLAVSGAAWVALPSRDGGRTWEEPRAVPIGAPSPGSGPDRPYFVDHDHWAVADGTRLHVTADAGRTWGDVEAVLPEGLTSLHDLWLTSTGAGWATADDAKGGTYVLHTIDSGSHWSDTHVPHLSP